MISTILPRYYKRYLSLPIFGSVVDEFVGWMAQRGYTLRTMQVQVRVVRYLDGSFRQSGIRVLRDVAHGHFDAAWRYYRKHCCNTCATVRHLERFLEETGRLAPRPPASVTPMTAEIDRFIEYVRRVRGLGPSAIRSYAAYLKRFLQHLRFDLDADALANVTTKEIDDFLCACAKTLNRYVLQHTVAFLRAFLRYQYERGVLIRPLHTMIDTPRTYRLEQIPRSLPWETVRAFIQSVDRDSVDGVRDYAMLYLMAAYGLRSCEIVSLTLDDIDWRTGVISVPQSKTRNCLALPLTDAVGAVLIAYLEKRPKLPYREIFLRIRAPQGVLRPSAVNALFRRRVKKSGLDIPFRGPHCIRHSYAVHLLHQGTSLKAIGDLLGHRTAESTCVYLRLALEDLRSVPLPVPIDTSPGPITKAQYQIGSQKRKAAPPNRSPLRSVLAGEIEDYLRLKHSLGRKFEIEAMTLRSLDAFLAAHYPLSEDLTGEIFAKWCAILGRLSSTVRRRRMQIVRNFCLYRRRSRPQSFLPDARSFPANHQPAPPYIVSESDMVRILEACGHLVPNPFCPLRLETLRIAFLLLFTTGIRRGELLRLKLGNLDMREGTISVKETKFHKSRIIPLSPSVSGEVKAYLELRHQSRLTMSVNCPVVLSCNEAAEGKGYTGTGLARNWAGLCASLNILTPKGRPPRLHDLRHSFAVNVLLRWYRNNDDVQAKLPLLSTYMGHVSVVSTYHYLAFVEELRSEASELFHRRFGEAVKVRGDAS